MAKISGFKGDYNGLEDNEAWTRVYDVGKNLMPIRNNDIQKKYNNMFKKKTKVIRGGQLKTINTDTIVPDDIVVLEKGNFIPVDGVILEEKGLDIENDILFNTKLKEVDQKTYVEGKPVYQGMKVKSGRALVEAKKIGDNTFLGEAIKEIDVLRENKLDSVNKYFLVMCILSFIVGGLGFLFSFFDSNDYMLSFVTFLVMLIVTLPIGFAIMTLIKLFETKNILRKSRLDIKDKINLLDFKNIDVICVDNKFLTKDYNKEIQNIYKAGIGIALISTENLEDTVLIAKEAGVVSEDFNVEAKNETGFGVYSGEEIDKIDDEMLANTVCDGLIFYDINHKRKKRIIKAFKKSNLSILCIGDGIEDLVSLCNSDISISSNKVKGSIDREIADAFIWGNDFNSIYEFVKNRRLIKKAILNCFNFNIAFQLPVIILLLMAIVKNIGILNVFWQVLIISLVVIPIMLRLTLKKYDDSSIFEPEKLSVNVKNYIKMLLIGVLICLILIVEYLGIGVLIKNELLNVSIVSVSLALIYFIVIRLLNK